MSQFMSLLCSSQSNLDEWMMNLVLRVSALLHVPVRPIRIQLSRDAEFIARTRQQWHDAPTVMLSPDNLRADVVAHEFAHCLVPSRSLFLAEGFATWAGCSISGTCEHLLFAEASLEDVVRRHWRGTPSVEDFLREAVGQGEGLAPERFSCLETRVAHAVAGSFCSYWHRRFPALAAAVAALDAPAPEALLVGVTSMSMTDLIDGWSSFLSRGVADEGVEAL